MRIIEFIYSLEDGGAETLVCNYVDLLSKRGHDVEIVTIYANRGTANEERVKTLGIKWIHLFPQKDTFHRCIGKITNSGFISLLLKREIKNFKPDVVHVHLSLLNVLLPISEQLNGIRVFYTCHSEARNFFSGARKKERIAAKKLIRQNGLQIIALHAEMAKELNKILGIEDAIVIRNGIDFNKYRMEYDRDKKRRELGLPTNAYLIGHIGRFSEEKNHSFLIQVFSKVVAKRRDVHLLLVGSGSLENRIREEINELGLEDRVTILSHRRDIPEILSSIDVFVFPSLYEGFSMTLLEAQVVGVPCVISDTISKESYLTPHLTVLPINRNEDRWAEEIVSPKGNIDSWGNISKYDLNAEIGQLERLYRGEPLNEDNSKIIFN